MSHRAIDQLIADWADPSKVKAFMGSHTFPLVEGSHVTFVWFGHADAVNIRHWVYGLESSTTLTRAPNTDIWHISLEIPANSRVEYKFEVQRNGHGEWIEDPLNPNRARDPFGANSVLQSAGYVSPEWTNVDPVARPGAVDRILIPSKSLGNRTIQLYLPARFRRSRKYPLLVVHDGGDYLNYTGLKTVLDNLIHRLEIPDMVVALTDSPDRLREYAADEAHGNFITKDLLPYLSARLPLLDEPRARGLMGASFGAVASFSTACRHPGIWGRLLLQSGSFAFTDIGRRNRRGPLFFGQPASASRAIPPPAGNLRAPTRRYFLRR